MLLSGWIDSSGWVHCPVCGNKTRTKVNRDTVLKRFPLFCPKCGHEHIIDVQENKIVSLEPDAKTQSRSFVRQESYKLSAFLDAMVSYS